MSAFLGPIHAKMYSRVLYQDTITEALLDLAAQRGWSSTLRREIDACAPAASTQPLETIVDPQNIHGWLSAAVEQCERRYALAVRGILQGHPQRLEVLRQTMSTLGEAAPLPTGLDAGQAFDMVHDRLLDGMPCDFPFVTAEADSDRVVWQVTQCPHAPHWADDAEVYYQLRDAWLEGALAGSGITHSRQGPYTHTLEKEARHA